MEEIDQLVDELIRRLAERRVQPRSTYRLQLTGQFTLHDAAALAGYLRNLGISHVYASPYLRARPGSGHGYDVCDHSAINPELGGAEGFAAFTKSLADAGLSHLVDVVPNHMSASSFNPWWLDVLENGPSSPYAGFFDIDWQPLKDELEGKVLLPILGQQYGEVLEAGQLVPLHENGGFLVKYFEHTLPLEPKSTVALLSAGLDALRQALGAGSEDCLEYESILNALAHLPAPTETSSEAVKVRQREKEVIKRRLRELETRSPLVAAHVAANLAEFTGRQGEAASFDRLDTLLDAQPYRLCHWRAASDEINYRRFFDVNELAALSMESPDVFYRAHELIGKLLATGEIAGLRIDHIDGLLSPEQYLWRLQLLYLAQLARVEVEKLTQEGNPPEAAAARTERAAQVLQRLCQRLELPPLQGPDLTAALGEAVPLALESPQPISAAAASNPPLYVVVEKILGPDEPLPDSWPTAGTTGYDFLKALGGLFVEPDGWTELQRVYDRFLAEPLDFLETAYEGKQVILRFAMASELQMLAHRLNRISEQHRKSRDFTLNMLRHALREILATFPVYRTYAGPGGVSERDRKVVQLAIARAKRRSAAVDSAVFDFIRGVLLLEHSDGLSPAAIEERVAFAGRFQQVTSPVMAKGVEDTAFYVYCPLLSANEVGGDPRTPTCSPADFHRENADRQAHKPLALLATSTHDTKRSEDVRARISVLGELPGRWNKAVQRWSRLNHRHIREVDGLPAPSRNDEYVFYQSLVGAWPVSPPTAEELKALTMRFQQYLEKASHEAKQRTSWINPNAAYDEALRSFVAGALAPGRRNRFLVVFQEFVEQVVDYGLYSALSQTVLKLTSPGVPDVYQGQELWDFSLVDPDNRRPVDFSSRQWLLGEINSAAQSPEGLADLARRLGTSPRDSRIKLLTTWRLLNLRREHPELFSQGEYLPLEVRGTRHRHLVAFARQVGNESTSQRLIVIVPRFLAHLIESRSWAAGEAKAPLGDAVWLDAEVALPHCLGERFVNVFTGEQIAASGGALRASDALRVFPVAVLYG